MYDFSLWGLFHPSMFMFDRVHVWPPTSHYIFITYVFPFIFGHVIYYQKNILIGVHSQNGIACTVDLRHDSLDVNDIFNSNNPNINNIKYIRRH